MSENKERKCIGVIIARPDREYQKGLLCGIYKAAFERDMNVAVFTPTISAGDTYILSTEIDIFTLPNFERLAGLIFAPDTFEYDCDNTLIIDPILAAIQATQIPAVTIDFKLEGLPCVESDDSAVVRSLLEHIIDDHNCRDVAYMTGKKGHPHAEKRLDVYRRVMAEHNLPVYPERTYYGDFWLNEGGNFVSILEKSEKGLPEAIVCANSYMAQSVYAALRERGINVPGDVIVAAYSDEPEMLKFITGTVKKSDAAGFSACRLLTDMIGGKKPEKDTLSISCGYELNRSVTCGCVKDGEYDFLKKEGVNMNEDDVYFSEYNFLSRDLISKQGYNEMFWGIDWYTFYMKNICGIYFCLCKDWDKPDFDTFFKSGSGYTDQMQLSYYREFNKDGSFVNSFNNEIYFPLGEMFPKLFDPEGEPSSFIFRPLHFEKRNFGYVVINNGRKMQTYDKVYDFWLRDVANALESQRRLQNMTYLYNFDPLTGAYNRNGFNSIMPELAERAVNEKLDMFVAGFDMNGLKYINDTFGHLEGDASIKATGDIIAECHVDNAWTEKFFHLSGDEFIKAAVGHFDEETARRFKEKITELTEEFNKSSGKPYPLYIAAGVCIKKCDDNYTVDSLIIEADTAMYEDKKRLKKETGFDPKRE